MAIKKAPLIRLMIKGTAIILIFFYGVMVGKFEYPPHDFLVDTYLAIEDKFEPYHIKSHLAGRSLEYFPLYDDPETQLHYRNIEGIVKCSSSGIGKEGITVIAKVNDNRHETQTDVDGSFIFQDLSTNSRIVLLIKGSKGTGRVALDGTDEKVTIKYPVTTEIVILHDNDQHFNFNFVDEIEDKISKIRNKYQNVLHLNAGDIFVRHKDNWDEPSLEWYADRAFFMIETMNRLGYDALTIGNHELDYQSIYTRKALEKANFPLLSANNIINTDYLPDFEPGIIFETIEGYTIAVGGLSRGEAEGVTLLCDITTAKEFMHLAGEHNLLIFLTHMGDNKDKKLAMSVPEIDIIIGGHSHGSLVEPRIVNDVMIARAGGSERYVNPEQPMYLGKIVVTLENGMLVDKRGLVWRFSTEGVEKLNATD